MVQKAQGNPFVNLFLIIVNGQQGTVPCPGAAPR